MSGRVSWTCGADLACSPLRGLEIGPAQCSGDFLLPRSAHVICSVYSYPFADDRDDTQIYALQHLQLRWQCCYTITNRFATHE